jgi:hypothetical protein
VLFPNSSAVVASKAAALTLAGLIGVCVFVWGGLALWYQPPGGRNFRGLATSSWVVFCCTIGVLLDLGRLLPAFVVLASGSLALLVWWRHLQPTNECVWADDVSQMTSGSVEQSVVTLRNVRNFHWRTRTDYVQRWETRSYDLSHLCAVDLILSYWSFRSIAHLLVSFGFANEDRVVFSVEVRRRRADEFSELGGFFKEFGLSIIAADERDIIRVRTNIRGEDDYLYRINLAPATMRSLFLEYVAQANRLIVAPRFYNTLTVNCTTLVYHMMKHVVGYLPWDYRVLLSGYLPEYLYRVRALDMRFSLPELRALGRITERARAHDESATFSDQIRAGVPALPTAQPPRGMQPGVTP